MINYFGKLPGWGDFLCSLPPTWGPGWESWIQAGLARLSLVKGEPAQSLLEQMPDWGFCLGLSGGNCLYGVMVPSRDACGRGFPFMLALETEGPQGDLQRMLPWFTRTLDQVHALQRLGSPVALAPWLKARISLSGQGATFPRPAGASRWIDLRSGERLDVPGSLEPHHFLFLAQPRAGQRQVNLHE